MLFDFLSRWNIRAAASPAQKTMPTTIPAMAPVPRPEPLVDEGLETEMEEEIAGRSDTDADLICLVGVAGQALDVTRDAGIDVCRVAETEDVESASTPRLHVTAFDCGELSTLKIGLRNIWGLPSEAL